jgi:hypothetical protein
VFVVFGTTLGNVPRVLGVVTPTEGKPESNATILSNARITRGHVTVNEVFYGADPTCCPSGTAVTTWTYDGERLHQGVPKVIHPARHS